MALEFITTRELDDRHGSVKGKIKLMKLMEEPDAVVEYACPACSFAEKRRIAWAEPFVSGAGANKKFKVPCGKCGFEIKFMKLKKETSKKAKG